MAPATRKMEEPGNKGKTYSRDTRQSLPSVIYWRQGMDSLDRQIQEAIQILKRGGLVAFPTDTVYGLGADAFNREAVKRVYEVKGRSPAQPLPLLVADVAQAKQLAASWPPLAARLAKCFWPGALTIVVPGAKSLPSHLVSDNNTIGLRWPKHPVPVTLSQGLGKPIIGTSANLSGQPSALTAEEVRAQLGNNVDFIIDGGRCPGGVESTVVDATGEASIIIRAGAVSKQEIESCFRGAERPCSRVDTC